MTKFSKIKNAIKRKVNESRVRKVVSSILDDSLPNLLAEIDQLDQAFLDAKPVKEEEDLEELDVRKTHGDRRIENPATGNDIKLRTALKAKKGSAVYAKGKAMYNALKDKPTNERAYASTDGKPYFDYDPGEDKLTEAEDYKYKKYVAKAFKDIIGATFEFRNAMGVKQLTNKDRKLKKKTDAIYKAVIDLQKEMKSDGLTEGKVNESMIGIKTKANFKPLQLKGALERAGIKGYQMNRLSVTLTALKIDKKYFKDAKKIIDGLGLSVMTAKESVKEGKLTEAKIKKGDVIKMDDGEIGVVNKVKGRVAYIKLPSMPGSFHPIEAARTTYKGKHKGKDIYSETKSAPAGHYFTKGGNVVKGRLSKAARTKGATKSDPKDKQRSKVPSATQRNESAKDKFGAPPMNKWWTGDKDALMSAIYHAQRQVPPSNKAAYEKNWKNIVKQLQRKFPAPTAIYRKRLTEDYSQRARNFRVILRQRLAAMKPGQKISYGKLVYTKDGNNFKDSKGRTHPAESVVQDLKHAVKPDILRHRGARGADMVNAYLKFEGKLTEAHPLNKVIGGYPVRYEGDPRNYRAIVTRLPNDRAREDIIKRASKAGYIAKPNMGGGVTIFVKEGKLTEAKFYVTYNQGRGMGKRVVTSKESDFEDPRAFRNYNDAEKYVKMAKSGGGTPGRITAYWVSDINMNRIDKAGRRI